MKRTAAVVAALLVTVGTVGACSTDEPATTDGTSAAGAQADDGQLPADAAALLADYGVEEGQDVRATIDHLDRLDEGRPLSVQGSVRGDEVIFSDGSEEVAVAIPGDEVYVSIAPFVQQTHECHYHALGSCQGEMVEEEFQVTITADDGEVLIDEQVSTWTNGFVGFWLPEDRQGTVSVTQGDLAGETPFDTGEGGATCITTLQLS